MNILKRFKKSLKRKRLFKKGKTYIGNKLPKWIINTKTGEIKSLWEKGKSKYIFARLIQEKKGNVSQLLPRGYEFLKK